MRLGTKKITRTHIDPRSQNLRHATFPPVLLFSGGPKTVSEQLPPYLPASHAALVEQTAICNSKLLNIVSRPPLLLLLLLRFVVQTNVFSPPALSIFAIPRVELAAEVTLPVSSPFSTVLCCPVASPAWRMATAVVPNVAAAPQTTARDRPKDGIAGGRTDGRGVADHRRIGF